MSAVSIACSRLLGLAVRPSTLAMADQIALSALSLGLSLALIFWTTRAEYAVFAQIVNLAVLAGPLHAGLFLSAATTLVAGADPRLRAREQSAMARAMLAHATVAIPVAVLAVAAFGPALGLADAGVAGAFAAALVAQWSREYARMQAYAEGDPAAGARIDFLYCAGVAIGVCVLVLGNALTAKATLVVMALAAIATSGPSYFRLLAARVDRQDVGRAFTACWRAGRWDAAGSVVSWCSVQSYLLVASFTRGLDGVAELAATRLVAVPIGVLAAAASNLLVTRAATMLRDGDTNGPRALFIMTGRAFCLAAALYWLGVAVAFPALDAHILPQAYLGLGDLALLWTLFGALTGLTTLGAAMLKGAMRFDRLFRVYLLAAPAYLVATAIAVSIDPRTGPVIGLVAGELVALALVLIAARTTFRERRQAASVR